MAQSTPLFVGLDVHKDSIAVAHAMGQRDPAVFVGEIGSRQADLDQLLRRLRSKTAALTVACEAGPSGTGSIATSPRRASLVTSWRRR